MSTSNLDTWHLLASVGAFAAATLAGTAVISHQAPRHFLPQQRMVAARAAGDDCFVFLGDSRMDAALDLPALHRAMGRLGKDACDADLAIGATDISGAYLTAREYLSTNPRPKALILGMAGDSLLDATPSMRPENMVGNNVIHLVWTRPTDVFDEVPDFPAAGIGSCDAAFRFLVLRATAVGRYQSLVWSRLQQIDRLVVGSVSFSNRFGGLLDMAALEQQLRAGGVRRIEAAMQLPPDGRHGRWFRKLRDLAQGLGLRLVVVELPMPRRYRSTVTDTEEAGLYRAWLLDDLSSKGWGFIDLSHARWATDSVFMDDLHLGPVGAAAFSSDLGHRLAVDGR